MTTGPRYREGAPADVNPLTASRPAYRQSTAREPYLAELLFSGHPHGRKQRTYYIADEHVLYAAGTI